MEFLVTFTTAVPAGTPDQEVAATEAREARRVRELAQGFRVVQLTPPGSACSGIFGSELTSAAPGSAEGLHLVVTDIEAARRSSSATVPT